MTAPAPAPTTGGGTQTLPRTQTSDGDAERFAHYVAKGDIVKSAVSGEPVEALCGKKWIPSRDPKKYPVCPTCSEMYANRIIDGSAS